MSIQPPVPRTSPASVPPSAAALPAAIPHPNLPLKLLHARERVLLQFRPLFHEFAITEQQWRVIRALLEAGPIEQRAVGELCGFASASLAGILARMEAGGFIERERLTGDQRRVRVRLTDASRALALRLRPRIADVYDRIEQRVGPQRMRALLDALDEVARALDEAGRESEAPARTR